MHVLIKTKDAVSRMTVPVLTETISRRKKIAKVWFIDERLGAIAIIRKVN